MYFGVSIPTKGSILSDLAGMTQCRLNCNYSFSKYLQSRTKIIENVSSIRKVMLVTKQDE